MRLATLTLLLAIQLTNSVTLNNHNVQLFSQKEVEDKGQCIALLEKILVEAYGTYKDVQDKDYAKVIGDVIALGQDVVNDVKCFENQNVKDVLEAAISRYSNLSDDTSDCIVNHLQDALADMKMMLADLFKGDWNGVQDSYNKVVDTFNDIKNC